ncbi:MAG: hypothetical protein IT224_01425 [Flavobacteriales bacterium]|nr:hypothetical protein [Flavobacteriales bacterium]
MLRTSSVLTATGLSILLLSGCHKGTGVGPEAQGGGLSALFEHNVENADQTFTVNATTGGVISGNDGVQVLFGPGAFRNSAGQVVSGPIEVKLVEALSIGDMIWFNKQTVGNDNGTMRLLRSGGEIRVTASQGQEQLVLGPQGMRVNMPTEQPDPNMGVFLADGMTEENMIWTLADTIAIDTVGTSWTGEVGPTPFYYQFTAPSFNWINCDYFRDYPNTSFLEATTPSSISSDSTMVWMAFPSENAVMNAFDWQPNTFRSSQVIPVGMSVIIVALARDGSDYSSAFTTVTAAPGLSVPLTFQPPTWADLETALDGL